MSKVIFAATLLAMGGSALAQTQPQATPASTAQAASKSDVNKIVCRMEDTIGSRLQAHKVCMTVQEWQAVEQENKDRVQQLQDLAGVRPSG